MTDDAQVDDTGTDGAEVAPEEPDDLAALVARVPPGWTEVAYAGAR